VKHDEFSGDLRLGNNPPIVVLKTKTKKGNWITTPEPVDGTTGTTGVKQS
jgi:hypothetical protein